jgi:hypothetical protein
VRLHGVAVLFKSCRAVDVFDLPPLPRLARRETLSSSSSGLAQLYGQLAFTRSGRMRAVPYLSGLR